MSLLNLQLKVWRQNQGQPGHFQEIQAREIPDHASFLEMMDIVNERLIKDGGEPVAFDHDCREGICGACSMTINGVPHGPEKATTTCQLHMRKFRTGDTIWVEPFRARAFPVIKDLIVDRSSFDRIQQSGGFVNVRTGAAPDANSILVGKDVADAAMDAAACIGCGACVAACKNARPEKTKRTLGMVHQMDKEGFGNCTNQYECEAACPKDISVRWITKLNRDYAMAAASDSFGDAQDRAESGD